MNWTLVIGAVGAVLAAIKILLDVAKLSAQEKKWIVQTGANFVLNGIAFLLGSFSLYVVYSFLLPVQTPPSRYEVVGVILHFITLITLSCSYAFGYFTRRHTTANDILKMEIAILKSRLSAIEQRSDSR